jgi:hypothetical protein
MSVARKIASKKLSSMSAAKKTPNIEIGSQISSEVQSIDDDKNDEPGSEGSNE